MTQVATSANPLIALLGRVIVEGDRQLTIDRFLDKVGTIKSGAKLPYLHLIDNNAAEQELHPQHGMTLLSKGCYKAMSILEEIAQEPIAATMNAIADEPTADEPTINFVVAATPVETISTADEPTADEPTADEPTADEPTADEPTADEPTADEPTADEPTINFVVAATPVETISTPVTDEPTINIIVAAPTETPKINKRVEVERIYLAGRSAGRVRKDIIAQMRTELDMSEAGARTYYQNAKTKFGH